MVFFHVYRFADKFSRIMKWLVLFFYVIATGAFVVFTLSAIKVIPPSTGTEDRENLAHSEPPRKRERLRESEGSR